MLLLAIGLSAVFALFGLVILVLPMDIILIVVAIKTAYNRKRMLIGLGLCVLCVPFGMFIYYPNVIEDSPFTHDHIITASAVHAGRNGGGRAKAQVAEGEKVIVNGVSRDRKEFNITTDAGVKGWIPAAAFPKDAADPVDNAFKVAASVFKSNKLLLARDLYGKNSESYGRDRDWRNVFTGVMGRYLEQKFEEYKKEDGSTGYAWVGGAKGLTFEAMRMALTAGQTTPARVKKTTGKNVMLDTELTLKSVTYAPEVTMIQIAETEETKETKETLFWEDRALINSVVLKDLDTGETFRLWYYERVEVGYDNHSIYEYYFIYPPTKARHFSLSHEKAGTQPWSFPEVTIAANAPTVANSPEGQAQKRIDEFKTNGSNAIVRKKALLRQNK
jgi:hypothetical protein